MKIERDPKPAFEAGKATQPSPQPSPESSDNQPVPEQATFSPGAAEFTTGLSPDEAEIEKLVAKLNQLSETPRENALSVGNAIQNGNYVASPEETADAILSGMEGRAQRDNMSDGKPDGHEPPAIRDAVTPVSEAQTRGHSRDVTASRRSRRSARPDVHEDDSREDSEQPRRLVDDLTNSDEGYSEQNNYDQANHSRENQRRADRSQANSGETSPDRDDGNQTNRGQNNNDQVDDDQMDRSA
jgi:hypothetical protein